MVLLTGLEGWFSELVSNRYVFSKINIFLIEDNCNSIPVFPTLSYFSSCKQQRRHSSPLPAAPGHGSSTAAVQTVPHGQSQGCATAWARGGSHSIWQSECGPVPQGNEVTEWGHRGLPEDVSFRDVPSDILQGTVTSGGWIWASAPGGAWPHAATQQHALHSQGQVRSLVPQWLTTKALFQVI